MKLSLKDLQSRFRQTPEALRASLDVQLPLSIADLCQVGGWDVIGVGASEAPARLLISVLSEAGVGARYVPISSLLSPQPVECRTHRGLAIFSQGLSPNAQIALAQAKSYRQSVLFTSVSPEKRPERAALLQDFPGMVIAHPPDQESGSLVRLIGPVCASLAALRFALQIGKSPSRRSPDWEMRLGEVADRYGELATESVEPLGADPAACLAVGADSEMAPSLMWKWQEALYTRLPVATDVLAFAHGPLQSLYNSEAVVFALRREDDRIHDELWGRLEKALHPERHRVVTLRASLPGPLALFEYDAQCNAFLLAEMRQRRIDPSTWPGKESDEPLYSIAGDSLKPQMG